MKSFQVGSILVHGLALFLALLCSNVKSNQEVCRSSQVALSKFFVLNELVFFTANPDHFDSMRIFNVSSGKVSNKFPATSLIPSLALQSAQGQESLLWVLFYDVRMDHCEPHKLKQITDPSHYCARVDNLKGLVVARLFSRQLVFMRHNSHKLMVVSDQYDFLEMRVLLKHLDKMGFTSSLSFDQHSDHFVSTHYGLHNQLCITGIRHQSISVPLPLLEDILNEHLFSTKCFYAPQTYTSVIDLRSQFFAVSYSGLVDQFEFNAGNFSKKQSSTDKAFLNCFGNSSANGIGGFEWDVNLVLESTDQVDYELSSRNDGMPKQARPRSMDEAAMGGQSQEASGGSFGNYFLLFGMLSIVALFGYLLHTRTIDGPLWITVARDSMAKAVDKTRDVARKAKEAVLEAKDNLFGDKTEIAQKKDKSSGSNLSSRQFSSLNLSQWLSWMKNPAVKSAEPSEPVGTNNSTVPSSSETSSNSSGNSDASKEDNTIHK